MNCSKLIIAAFFITITLSSCANEEDKNSSPNIIFLLTDDQRYDMLGINGNTVIQTPHIDRLGKQGTNFTNHYVTTSICSVSRASILSGQYGRRHGLWGFGQGFTSEAFSKTYPMILQANGYFTGFIGKYGVGPISLPSAGFEYWNGFGGQGSYSSVDKDGNSVHLTAKMGGQILDFLDNVPEDKPFCLSVSFKAPHVQDGASPGNLFQFDQAYREEYEEIVWERPFAAADEYQGHFPLNVFQQNNVARSRWRTRFETDLKYDHSLEGYYRLVHGVDVQVGRLVAKLDSLDLADNTIIIFTSDNGFYLGEYGFAGKWYGSEPSIRTPLIIYDPRNKKANQVDAITLNLDLAPTILKFAGISPPDDYQGDSLLPLLNGEVDNIRDAFFYEHLWPITPGFPILSTEGIVTKDQKLMKYFTGMESQAIEFEEMYNLISDPNEVRNLSSDEAFSSQKAALEQEFQRLKTAAE